MQRATTYLMNYGKFNFPTRIVMPIMPKFLSNSANKNPDGKVKLAKSRKDDPKKQIQVFYDYREKPYSSMSAGEKVVEGSKDTFYTFVIVAGIAVTGFVGYIIFRELFSRETPNGIYTEALKMCRTNEELRILLGTPMLGHGEETRRGRRWLIAHEEFLLDGVKCMRMQFHVKGPIAQGLVNLEVRKNSSNKYEYRYLFVETMTSRHPVVIVDRRSQ